MQNTGGRKISRRLFIYVAQITLLYGSLALAQQPSVVPTLVNFTGTVTDANGKPLSGTTGITFFLYKDQQNGSPLWIETQNVQPDKFGHYTVMLGATKSQGLPTELFASGEARWLGVQVQGQVEQPRVMLLAVPYALKAGDAQTVGGLPASAFVLAPLPGTTVGDGSPVSPSSPNTESKNTGSNAPIGGSGTTGFLAGWIDNNGDLGNTILFQKGTGKTAMIGLNENTPLANLDVNGTELVRGLFESATTGLATASKGFNSNPTDLEASSFNSATNKAVMQHFEWQAEPAANNTAAASGTLNLLFATDTNKPAETGLKLSNKGLFTFASGQTFPGAGTITSVVAGTDLTGGGSSGKVTLNLDTTQVPQLNAANTFSQTQVVNAINPFGAVFQASSPYQAITGTMTSNDFFTPAIFGNAAATGSGVTIGVEGAAATDSGYGVYGTAGSTGTGVYGTSANGIGVAGNATAGNAAGVNGINTVSGYGVMGKATGSSGQGVWGESFGTSFSNGSGADGVHGVAHSNEGAGVAGINDATDGTGIYGSDTGGYGFTTDSHTSQSRSMGGWVKAMVYFEPTSGAGIKNCFNSQLAGSSAATPPCGITFTYNSGGNYTLDFGFEVDDRFVSLTEQNAAASSESWLCRDRCFPNPSANQINIFVCDDNNPCNLGDRVAGLFVVVY